MPSTTASSELNLQVSQKLIEKLTRKKCGDQKNSLNRLKSKHTLSDFNVPCEDKEPEGAKINENNTINHKINASIKYCELRT